MGVLNYFSGSIFYMVPCIIEKSKDIMGPMEEPCRLIREGRKERSRAEMVMSWTMLWMLIIGY